jgi:hypothetical protein
LFFDCSFIFCLQGGISQIFREPSRKTVTATTPEPSRQEWTADRNMIAQFNYRSVGTVPNVRLSGPTQCTNVKYGSATQLGQIVEQLDNDASEPRICHTTITIPDDTQEGINRYLYQWHSPPNDAWF